MTQARTHRPALLAEGELDGDDEDDEGVGDGARLPKGRELLPVLVYLLFVLGGG